MLRIKLSAEDYGRIVGMAGQDQTESRRVHQVAIGLQSNELAKKIYQPEKEIEELEKEFSEPMTAGKMVPGFKQPQV